MPFKSEAQRRWMLKRRPAMARRWAKKYGVPPGLPEKVAGALGKDRTR